MSAPPLSVVIAARSPWPALRASLDAVYPQAVAVGAEILIAISGAHVKPPDPGAYPLATWLEEPDASVFRLRALAFSRARGDVISITEDHAIVDSDWCRRILESHAAFPDAAAIGGVVENGATMHLVDWADFFIANGRFMRPIANGPTGVISQQANSSLKRRFVPVRWPAIGLMHMMLHRDLRSHGETLVADDRIVAQHGDPGDLRHHSSVHYHNGRSIAGFRAAQMRTPMRLLRAIGCFVLPAYLLWRTVVPVVVKRRHRRTLVASLPLMIWLLACHAAGELAGYLAGAGDSPNKIP